MPFTNLVNMYNIQNGVIYAKVLDGKDFNPDDLIETYTVFEKEAGGKPYSVILDARDISVGQIPPESFKLNSSKKYTPNQIAEAYLSNSFHIRFMINFYFRFFKPVIPSRMFETQEMAMNWLSKIKAQRL